MVYQCIDMGMDDALHNLYGFYHPYCRAERINKLKKKVTITTPYPKFIHFLQTQLARAYRELLQFEDARQDPWHL